MRVGSTWWIWFESEHGARLQPGEGSPWHGSHEGPIPRVGDVMVHDVGPKAWLSYEVIEVRLWTSCHIGFRTSGWYVFVKELGLAPNEVCAARSEEE